MAQMDGAYGPIVPPASLDEVYAPVRVAAAPSDAYIGLSRMPDGELRHYNYGEQADAGSFYLSSRDGGLTWQRVRTVHDLPLADTRNPLTGTWVRLTMGGAGESAGTWCIRYTDTTPLHAAEGERGTIGPRTVTRISDLPSIMLKPPVFADGGRRIIVAGHGGTDPKGCYTYVSTDDGVTWTRSNTVTAPNHVKGGYHLGTRWNHGAVEPTVTPLADGRLWMLMRTSQDRHYEAFSSDGGLTWSESRPSAFWGTITMPTFYRLADGRLLLFWTSTTPLPEMATATGVWDDVFTNRDVTHVAISDDDGATWRGMRELWLNPIRDREDFGTWGGGIDKSVHQAQAVEVAPGKVCVALGQHPLLRSIILFDVAWLYETSRESDFSNGLADWTTFVYRRGIVGHCAYNRQPGLSVEVHLPAPTRIDNPMTPRPPQAAAPRDVTADGRHVLRLRYERDTTLVADTRGAVWNFPALTLGQLTLRLRMPADGDGRHYLLLGDHWCNPCDSVARTLASYELPLTRRALGIRDSEWHDVTLQWDVPSRATVLPDPKRRTSRPVTATVLVDGRRRTTLPLQRVPDHGISYLHLLALPTAAPGEGILIDRVATQSR